MAYDKDHPEYVSLGHSVFGHLTIAVAEAVVVFMLLCAANWYGVGHRTDVATLAVMAAGACALSAVACAVAERPAVVRAEFAAPGGWDYAIWMFVLPPVAGYLVGGVESVWWGVVCGAATWAVNVAEALWVQPWKPGISRAQVRENWEELKAYADELSLQDGWVEGARQQVDGQRPKDSER